MNSIEKSGEKSGETSGGFAIEAAELLKNYGELTAVNHVSFQVRYGEAFGMLGPNGAGKSTMMRMVYCRTPLTAGLLKVLGHDVTREARAIKEKVGVVPQENNLDPDLNVRDNLLVYARYFRIPRLLAEERADQLIEFVELQEKRDAHVETLSGGMKRRLMIARALLNQPKILVLDEPTTGLDPHVRLAIWEKLRELRNRGLTILLSTHYMDEAEKLCERLVIVDKGKILVSGAPRELIEKHAKHSALEIRGCNGRPLKTDLDDILAEQRGSTHFYFALSADQLAPLLSEYEDCEKFLRPSNLEDVFLRLTDRDRLT